MALLLKCGCIALYTTQVPAQLSLRPCINLPLEFQSRDHFQKKREAQFMFLSDWPFLFTGCDLIIRYLGICQWIYLPLVCQSRDQFHDIIQWKLLSCFNELNLLLCWFWFDHMLQLFVWIKSRKIFTRVNISTVSLFVLLKKLQWMDYEKAFLWNLKYYTGDASTLWSHSRRRQLY